MESDIIDDYLKELKLNGRASSTIDTYRSLLNPANRWKPLDNWTKKDINNYCILVQETKKPVTFEATKLRLKKFFEWKGSDIANHLVAKVKAADEIDEKDILTVEEVQLMIDSTESPLYQALIAFLFESGARISEVLPIIVSDIEETDKGMQLGVYETKIKDRKRPILCLYSFQYIRNLINYLNLGKDDKLFDIGKSAAYKMLVKIGKDAGIEKQTNPHRLRHAQARQMLIEKYDPLIIDKKMGWRVGSDMRARYSHVGNKDVINATFEHAGGEAVRVTPKRLAEPEEIKKIDSDRVILKLNEENQLLKERLDKLEKHWMQGA